MDATLEKQLLGGIGAWPGVPPQWRRHAETLLECPQLPQVLNLLARRLGEETARRQRFYEEITPEDKWEFIAGEVVLHSPSVDRHTAARMLLSRLMQVFVERGGLGLVRDGKALCVFTRNDYEPDIVYFGAEKVGAIVAETMKYPVPDLIVEVLSKSTQTRDRGVKFDDYAAHGVGEYWIVNPDAETLEQYLNDGQGGWILATKSGSGEVASQTIGGFRIPVRAIFDIEENLRVLAGMVAAS